MGKNDRDKDKGGGSYSTPSRSTPSTPTRAYASPSRATPSTPTRSYSAPVASNPNTRVAVSAGNSGHQGGGAPAHGSVGGDNERKPIKAPVKKPVNTAPVKKPEPGKTPGVPVDTGKPVAPAKPRQQTALRLEKPAARSSDQRDARQERPKAKTQDVDKRRAERPTTSSKKPAARSSDQRDARQEKKAEPGRRNVCKARPKDTKPKGGGGGRRDYVPWCG